MATQIATRYAQDVLVAEFTIDLANDSMVNTSAAEVAFNAAAGTVYDVINLPNNAIVVGGQVQVVTASNDATTATIDVGDSVDDDRYTATPVDMKTLGSTALTITGFQGGGENIRITLANGTGGATAGEVRVVLFFIIKDRSCEVYPQ